MEQERNEDNIFSNLNLSITLQLVRSPLICLFTGLIRFLTHFGRTGHKDG